MSDNNTDKNDVSRPWHQNLLIILPLFVFIFSIISFIFSEIEFQNEQNINDYNNLGVILQKLTILPKENFVLMQKYKDYPVFVNEIGGSMQIENGLLLAQANAILNRIPPKFVTSYEYYIVGHFYFLNQQYPESINMLNKAISYGSPTNIVLQSMLVKSIALGYIDYDAGKDYFNQTITRLKIEGFANRAMDYYYPQITFDQLKWTDLEILLGHYQEAQKSLDIANSYYGKINKIYLNSDPFKPNLILKQNLLNQVNKNNLQINQNQLNKLRKIF